MEWRGWVGTPDTLRTYTPRLQNSSVLQLPRENTPACELSGLDRRAARGARWLSHLKIANIAGELITNSESTLQLQNTLDGQTSHWLLRGCVGWGRGQGRELGRSGNHTRLSPSFNVGTTRTQNHSKKELANYKLQIPYPLEILISRSGVGPTYIYLFSR